MNLKWCYSDQINGSILEQIKHNRKISESFISSSLRDLPDISLLKDLKLASNRIIDAILQKEKIMIFGHDDVDGITSTYILFDFLEKIGSQNHFYYIPNRLLESHGMKENFVKRMLDEDFDLLITVDGGISEFEQISVLSSAGIDVIITDHHLVQDKIPPAYAVVNPKQPDCEYPFKMLAGVTVTYFLIKQIAAKLESEINLSYLFWTVVGTIADKVPLVGVNRIITREVLENWFSYNDPSIEVMKSYFIAPVDFEKRMSILKFIGKILSNGRLPSGKNLALSFLLASTAEKEVIIDKLIRQQRDHEYKLNNLNEFLNLQITAPQESYLIFEDADDIVEIHLMGYTASILAKKFMIPVVVLKERENVISGEGRCTDGFNLVEAFNYCREFLIQFGGHKKAAGFTIEKAQIDAFIRKFSEFVKTKIGDIEYNRMIKIDAVFSMDEMEKLENYLQSEHFLLQPFGQGNSKPKFLVKNFLPERDLNTINLKKAERKLESDKVYNLVIAHQGNSFNLIDYRTINYLL